MFEAFFKVKIFTLYQFKAGLMFTWSGLKSEPSRVIHSALKGLFKDFKDGKLQHQLNISSVATPPWSALLTNESLKNQVRIYVYVYLFM